MIKKFVLSIFLLSGIAAGVNAQIAASPYSIFGIGTLSSKALIYQNNMGGLGISNGKSWILNNINPALLPLNTWSTFDAGLSVERRDLNTSELKQSNTSGGLSYLALAFPIRSGKWTMAAGLMPYSNVSYNITASGSVSNRDEANANYQYTGSGGINQVYLSSGWQLIPNFLSFGVRAAYSFGTVTDESIVDVSELVYINDSTGIPKNIKSATFYRSSRYSDFLFESGLNMKKRIGKDKEVDLGFVYEFASNMNTTRDERLEIIDNNVFPPPTDTIVHNANGITYLPQKFGVGLSISKAYKWTFGADFYSRDWTQFTSDFGTVQELAQSYEIIVGGEFTPDFLSVNSYLKRVTYQFGFNYEQTPVKINNKNIDDFGINFGVSLPAGASIFNFGFKFGTLGTSSNGLIREDYFKINLGMTFNDRSYGWYRNQSKFK